MEQLYSHLGKEKVGSKKKKKEKVGSITHTMQHSNPQQLQWYKYKYKTIQAGEVNMRKMCYLGLESAS